MQAANIENAAAVVYGGKRYVLYNPNFINQLVKATGTQWAAISVLAHEIGHHLNGHTLGASGSQHASELEADEFSGFVLRKMGASLQEAQTAMKTAASQRASTTHPAQYDRLDAIAKGWNQADDQQNGRTTVARNTAPQVQQRQQQPAVVQQHPATRASQPTAVAGRSIIGDVRFTADPRTRYYITNKMDLVKVLNNQWQVIGKLTSLRSAQYPYMIYDNSNTQLLVDTRGTIVTKTGRPVGVLNARS